MHLIHSAKLSLAELATLPVDVPHASCVLDVLVVLEIGRDGLTLAQQILPVEQLEMLVSLDPPYEAGSHHQKTNTLKRKEYGNEFTLIHHEVVLMLLPDAVTLLQEIARADLARIAAPDDKRTQHEQATE